jgi:hypothetical protein
VTLDLEELLCGWDPPEAEICARLIRGRDGEEVVQMRIDVGLMQMMLNGRPDGERYRGMASALAHLRHELPLPEPAVVGADWMELLRELNQFNYRRLALSGIADLCLAHQEAEQAARMLRGAIRDIDACLACIGLLESKPGQPVTVDDDSLPPTLLFNRARHLAQLRVIEGRYEDAIEAARQGADHLRVMLEERRITDEADRDPGVVHLNELADRLRADYHIARTLREQLEHAVAIEDYAAAAALRKALEGRPPVEREGEFAAEIVV